MQKKSHITFTTIPCPSVDAWHIQYSCIWSEDEDVGWNEDTEHSIVALIVIHFHFQIMFVIGLNFAFTVFLSFGIFVIISYQNDAYPMIIGSISWLAYYFLFVFKIIGPGSATTKEGKRMAVLIHKTINFEQNKFVLDSVRPNCSASSLTCRWANWLSPFFPLPIALHLLPTAALSISSFDLRPFQFRLDFTFHGEYTCSLTTYKHTYIWLFNYHLTLW